jgi:hypothetical protein
MPAASNGRIVRGHEHHGVRPIGQGLADQHLLLADVIGRLGHIVHGASTGLSRHPVGGKARRRIGRIDPVLGEDGERGGTGHVSSSWFHRLLRNEVGILVFHALADRALPALLLARSLGGVPGTMPVRRNGIFRAVWRPKIRWNTLSV